MAYNFNEGDDALEYALFLFVFLFGALALFAGWMLMG